MSSATTAGRVRSKSIYDTSVYINAIRSRAYYESILLYFARALPTTYFCAVVAQELKAGCHTPAAHERVEAFLRPFRRTGRLVAPTFADWEETGALLARMLTERPDLKDKLPHLLAQRQGLCIDSFHFGESHSLWWPAEEDLRRLAE